MPSDYPIVRATVHDCALRAVILLFIPRYMQTERHGSGCAVAPRGAPAGFCNKTFPYPEPACAIIVRHPSAPSSHNPPDTKKRGNTTQPPHKGKTNENNILEGRAWPIPFLAGAYPDPCLVPPPWTLNEKLSCSSSSKSGPPANMIRPGIFPTLVSFKKAVKPLCTCFLASRFRHQPH